jgi:hypothetical protein
MEIKFLNGLGSGEHRKPPRMSKKRLLINYIKASENRQRWGAIKKQEVLDHARALLALA